MADEATALRAAAVNEFLFQLALGHTPLTAFERALRAPPDASSLRWPAELSLIVKLPKIPFHTQETSHG